MYALRRNQFQFLRPIKSSLYNLYQTQSQTCTSSFAAFHSLSNSAFSFRSRNKHPQNATFFRNPSVASYSSRVYRGPIPRTLRRRIKKRERAAAKPVLNAALFEAAKSRLPPRFTPKELHDIISLQDDPLVCLEHQFRMDDKHLKLMIKPTKKDSIIQKTTMDERSRKKWTISTESRGLSQPFT